MNAPINQLHGIAYQLNLLMVFLHRTFINTNSNESTKYDEYRFYTELQEAEKFDDLLLKYRQNGEMWKTRLFQFKHTEKKDRTTSITNLVSKDDAFSVEKYFSSFIRIREKCDILNEHSIFYHSEIQDLSIVTNIGIENQTILDCFDKIPNDNNFVIFGPHQSQVQIYQFKTSGSEQVDKLKDILKKRCDFKVLIKRLVEWTKNGKPNLSCDNVINFYIFPLVKYVFDLTADRQFLTFKKDFLVNSEYEDFRTVLFSEFENNKINTVNLNIKSWKNICASMEIVEKANAANLTQFADQICDCVNEQGAGTRNNVLTLSVPPNQQDTFIPHLVTLSDYILIKGGKIQFNAKLFGINEIPPNLIPFRNQLKTNLSGGKYNELHRYEFKIEDITVTDIDKINGEEFSRKLPTNITNSDIYEFIGKFKIIIYPGLKEVKQILLSELGKRWGKANSRIIYSHFEAKMYSWMTTSNTVHNKESTENIFTECEIILENHYLSKTIFSSKNIQFEEESKFNDHLIHNQICYFKFGDLTCWRSKVMQHLEQCNSDFVYIQEKSQNQQFVEKAIQCFQKSESYNILVMEFEKNFTTFQSSFKMISKILENNKNKKFVILMHKEMDLPDNTLCGLNICEFIDENSSVLNSFTKESQTNILENVLHFQGYDIPAYDLFNNEDVQQLIDEPMITNLIDRKTIKIGQEIKQSKGYNEYYINRNFGCSEGRLFSEEELLADSSRKLILISNVAGMGKTTVTTSLVKIFKKGNPSKWCFRINLNDCGSMFNEIEKKPSSVKLDLDFLIQHLFDDSLVESHRQILKIALNIPNNAVIFLDGFDEISPRFDTVVIDIIKLLLNHFKIFVTSRPQRQELLTETFKGKSKTYNLQPLDEKSQKEYLIKYWKIEWKTDEDFTASYCEKITSLLLDLRKDFFIYGFENSLISTPLHLEMVRTIIDSKETADKILASDNETFTILKIYELFTKRKYEIYVKDKLNLTSCVAAQLDENNSNSYKLFLVNHTMAAINSMMERSDIQKLIYIQKFDENLKSFQTSEQEKGDRHGLISHFDCSHRPNYSVNQEDSFVICEAVFIHRTFAEYFVAKFITNLMIDPQTDVEKLSIVFKYICRNVFVETTLTENFCKTNIYDKPDMLEKYKSTIVIWTSDRIRELIEHRYKKYNKNTNELIFKLIKDNVVVLEKIIDRFLCSNEGISDGMPQELLNNCDLSNTKFYKNLDIFHRMDNSNFKNGNDLVIEKIIRLGIQKNYFKLGRNDELLNALFNRKFEMAKSLPHSDIAMEDKIAVFSYFVWTEDKDSIDVMLNCGVDLHSKFNLIGGLITKHTALFYALKTASIEMIKFWVYDKGINLNERDDGSAVILLVLHGMYFHYHTDENFSDLIEVIKTVCSNYIKIPENFSNQIEDTDIFERVFTKENKLEAISYSLGYILKIAHDLYMKILFQLFETPFSEMEGIYQYTLGSDDLINLYIEKLDPNDVDKRNGDGVSLLQVLMNNQAIGSRFKGRIICCLLGKGADGRSLTDKNGNTIFHIFVEDTAILKYNQVGTIFKSCSSIINERNKKDETPLDTILWLLKFKCDYWGKDEDRILKLLLKNGADPFIPNSMGISAFLYSQTTKHKDRLLKLFKKYGNYNFSPGDIFLQSDNETFTILNHYETIIKKAYDIYVKDIMNLTSGVVLPMDDDHLYSYKQFLENHTMAAINSMIKREDLEKLMDIQKFVEKLKSLHIRDEVNGNCYGLITNFYWIMDCDSDDLEKPFENDETPFNHRTFAEYFLAEFIANLMIDPQTDVQKLTIIFEYLYGNVFLDTKLTENFCKTNIYDKPDILAKYKSAIKMWISDRIKEFMEYRYEKYYKNTNELIFIMIKDNVVVLEKIIDHFLCSKEGISDGVLRELFNICDLSNTKFYKNIDIFHRMDNSNFKNGNDSVIEKIIRHGIEKNYFKLGRNDEFLNALFNRKFETAKSLPHSDIAMEDKIAVFSYFVWTEDKDRIDVMLNCGVDPHSKFNLIGGLITKHTALFYALKTASIEMIKFWVCDKWINLNERGDGSAVILYILYQILEKSDPGENFYSDLIEVIKTICSNYNKTCKNSISQTGDADVIERVFTKENKLEAISYSLDYISKTAHDFYMKILFQLFETPFSEMEGIYQYTFGRDDLINLFIEKLDPNDVDKKNDDGVTLLQVLMNNQNSKSTVIGLSVKACPIICLLQKGADGRSLTDKNGNTVLHVLVEDYWRILYHEARFKLDLEAVFESHRFHINDRNGKDETPLDILLRKYYKRYPNIDGAKLLLELLLKNGANPLLLNSKGISALHVVHKSKQKNRLINIFADYGHHFPA